MNEVVNIVKDWPIIVQGALGSGLFWFILLVFQYAMSKINSLLSHYSKQSRISWLVSLETKYEAAISEDDNISTYNISILLMRCLRPFLKALMWLSMGLMLRDVLYPAEVIGFIGCIYYLFKSYEIISPMPMNEDWDKELDKMDPKKQEQVLNEARLQVQEILSGKRRS